MGLDVYLYQFKDVDTDAVVKLGRYSREPWAFEAYNRWTSLSESDRRAAGPFPSDKDRTEARARLAAKARELGLPEAAVDDSMFGGVAVRFPSRKHPHCSYQVGEWDGSFPGGLIERDFYYVFPEANGDPMLVKPDWAAAKGRILEILEAFRKLGPKFLDEEFGRMPDHYFPGLVERIEVVLETIEFVLSHENPGQFLLYWSA